MDEIEETRHQIEETRSQMSETIDAIQEKLNPDRLVQQAKDTVREATIGRAQEVVSNVAGQAKEMAGNAMEATKEMASNVVDSTKDAGESLLDMIRRNPLPAALAGISLGWLWMSARKQNSSDINASSSAYGRQPVDYDYDRETNTWRPRYAAANASSNGNGSDNGQSKVSQVMGQAQDKASQVAGQVGDKVGDIANQAQDQAGRAVDWFQSSLQQNPLAVGVVAVALGAVVGLSLPSTQQENQIMGSARDNLADMAQQKVQDLRDKVTSVAQEAVDSAKDAAKNQGLVSQNG